MNDKITTVLTNYINMLESELATAKINIIHELDSYDDVRNEYVGFVGVAVDFLSEHDAINQFIEYVGERLSDDERKDSIIMEIEMSIESRKEWLESQNNED